MKKIFNLCLVFLGVTGLTSCLDEDPFFDPEAVENVIEFYSAGNVASPATAPYPLFINSFEIVPEVDFPIVVGYSGADVAPEDITVTIGIANESVLEEYNESEGTHYELLPASVYTLPSTTVTIPKGERRATYIVKLKTNQFDLTKNFALPLTITNASTGIVSGNFNTAVFSVGAKNRYDGLYEVEGTMIDRTNAAFKGYYPKTIALVTQDLNSNSYYDYDQENVGHIFDTGAGLSVYGTFTAVFHFDDSNTTDLVDPVASVTNAAGQPVATGTMRAGMIEPTGVNKFTFAADGTPLTMEVTYTMTQTAAMVPRTTWTETYTYIGPRP